MRLLLAIAGAQLFAGCTGLTLRVETPDGPAIARAGSGSLELPTPASFEVPQRDFYGRPFSVLVTRGALHGECAVSAYGGGMVSAQVIDVVSCDASVWKLVENDRATVCCWLPREGRYFVKYQSEGVGAPGVSVDSAAAVVSRPPTDPSRSGVQSVIVACPLGDSFVEDDDQRIDFSIPAQATVEVSQGWRPIEGWQPGVVAEWKGDDFSDLEVEGATSDVRALDARTLRFSIEEGSTATLRFEMRSGPASIRIHRKAHSREPVQRIRITW